MAVMNPFVSNEGLRLADEIVAQQRDGQAKMIAPTAEVDSR